MIESEALDLPPAAVGEAKDFLRIAHGGEDALVAQLLGTAAELCEQFTARLTIARGVEEVLPAGGGWQRLGRTPVRSIEAVAGVDAAGASLVLAPAAYAVDVDADGDGWVRLVEPGATPRLRVAYRAGMAEDWAGLPEPLRHGIIRLAAHLYAERTGAEAKAPPAAVTALWRPWRRLSFGRAVRA